jgi:hypothetical protein
MRTENKIRNFWLRTLILLASVIVHQLFLPWWGMVAGCILGGYLTAPMNRAAFMAGFISVFLIWGGLALYLDLQNDSILSSRVIRLFPLPQWPVILVLITALIGGLTGGLACKTGELLRRFTWKEKARYY